MSEQEQEAPKHWIDNEHTRGRFWAEVRNLGYTDRDEVYRALVCGEHVHDFTGTPEEALEMLAVWKQTQQERAAFEHCGELPESPLVAWTRVQSPLGLTWSITLRAGLPAEVEGLTDRAQQNRMQAWEGWLQAQEWLRIYDGRDTPDSIGTPEDREAQAQDMRASVQKAMGDEIGRAHV